ncbi:uncharacterized protein LOC123300486 [Chrysoperla carnea]|uniref:uncharacterized protein LOC123300486 n=1 Tax=Chrysoperla carnea TaxID=189513 RepID=UPI001D0658DD|nr:uncharacterized protein LOC123300486 [Chrysoperla carnea]
MKTFLVILFGCLCIMKNGLVKAEEIEAEAEAASTPSTPAYCEEAGLTCFDCETLQSCAEEGDAEPEFTIQCKVQNPNLPYCDKQTGQCVAENVCDPDTEAPEVKECYNNGTRPDPTDCSQYIQCISDGENGFIGTVVKCPQRTQFNAAQGRCITSTQCLSIDRYCNTANAGKLIRYPPYPANYAKCPAANSNEKIIVKLCKGEYVFNQQTAVCEPVCKREGYIANNLNCHAYYNCVRTSNGAYSITSNICPKGYGFNPVTKSCEKMSTCTNVGRSLFLRRKRDLLESLTLSGYYDVL